MRSNDITGIILVGGKSTRMGSEKGLVLLNRKPFVQHVLEAMKPLVSKIIIVGNDEVYDQFGVERIDDVLLDAGPLAGLYSGLLHSKTENNLVLSCDVPIITTSLLQKLLSYRNGQKDIVQFVSNGKTMPLIATYKKRCASKCLELLNEGERRLLALTNVLKTEDIVLPEEDHWATFNINTPTELELAKQHIKEKSTCN
ncbi:molybdenum cofactor guanylyltransferase [Sungkyunkwania multivorans]|uniref:Probable molybdenum cofactor guanylyltransferase n=1 Tax=Sungkyunkwania multivorans TaxID=1173618 RepID=A0ABW3D3U4_9FLAO